MRFQGRGWSWFKNGLTLMVALSFGVAFWGRISPPKDRVAKATPLPAFSLRNLQNPSELFTSKQLKGKVVVLNFWATWCAACKRTMPVVQKLHKHFADQDVVVLGVTDDNPKAAAAYLKSQGYDYPVLWDRRARLGTKFNITGIPFTVFFDKSGRALADRTGLLDETECIELISEGLE